MGLGTWAWGNQLLWGYDEGMDSELQQVFNLAISNGVNLFDTADSYGQHPSLMPPHSSTRVCSSQFLQITKKLEFCLRF